MADETLVLPAVASWRPPQPELAGRADARPRAESRPLFPYLAFAASLVLAALIFAYTPLHLVLTGGVDGGGVTLVGAGFATLTVLAGLRWCLFFILAFLAHERGRRRPVPASTDLPPVSILVPAYNEGETIEAALRSLVDTDYPAFEIIVVDDGSKDDTYEKAKPFEGTYDRCRVRVYTKPNGGKWSALNYDFHRSTSELVLCVDADSRLEPQALGRLVARMSDPQVVAVAGQVRVRNRVNLLTRLQALEYVIANGLVRMAQSLTGTVLVVPGPIGLFRRAALEEVYIRFGNGQHLSKPGEVDGPFEGDTFAEDFDLSLALLSLGGDCVYEPHAVSQTKAPDWTFRLISQRYRWCRGTIQVLRKYWRRCRAERDLRRPRLLAWLGVTYALELLVLPLVNAGAAALACLYLAGGGSALPLLGWALTFMLLNLNAAAFFVACHNERLRTLLVLPFYDLYHGFMLNFGLVIAAVDEVRGRSMRW
jgi:cellulose synthase/poly-beta-1,6-N-acetylglucosamine synthase-like glycosyltransferase